MDFCISRLICLLFYAIADMCSMYKICVIWNVDIGLVLKVSINILLQTQRQCNIAPSKEALFISNLSVHTHHTLSFGSVVPVLAPSPLYSFVWASLYQIQGRILRGYFGSGGR